MSTILCLLFTFKLKKKQAELYGNYAQERVLRREIRSDSIYFELLQIE